MPRPIPKLTIVEVETDVVGPAAREATRRFEVVKVENSIRWAVGEIVTEREINSALSGGAIRTTLIRRKS